MPIDHSEFQQLQDLLVAPEAAALRGLEQELESLRDQVHDPARQRELLAALIPEIFRRGDPVLSQAVIDAIVPLLDQAIRQKTEQDPAAMSGALAAASTGAIARHYAAAPQAAARDLGPLVSASIREEIRSERDAVIDALYPVIGSTIAKYFSQTLNALVHSINERIESQLGLKSLVRRARARFLGISEAELVLREGMPWSIEAAFLIHKASGLVVVQAQSPGTLKFDPDLLSGMLTAIRSLFNDALLANREDRELDQIQYGEFTILLEVAGYSYLAAVIRGVPDERCRAAVRQALATVVEEGGPALEKYDGDAADLPPVVPRTIDQLTHQSHTETPASRRRVPVGFMLLAAFLLLLFLVPLGFYLSREARDRDVAARAAAALAQAAPSPFKDISVRAERGTLRLSGLVPNAWQRTRAGGIVAAAAPGWSVDNGTEVAGEPPLPVLGTIGVRQAIEAVNSMDGVLLDAQYREGDLALSGVVPDSAVLLKVNRTFAELPAIHSFSSAVKVGEPLGLVRIFFERNSTRLDPGDLRALEPVTSALARDTTSGMRIVGYSDLVGTPEVNLRVALGRAAAVREEFVKQGISGDRLQIEGVPAPPPGTAVYPDSLSRCVRFIPVSRTPGTVQ